MHGRATNLPCPYQRFVETPIAQPASFVVQGRFNINRAAYEAGEAARLLQRLAILLPYPRRGTIGRNDDQRHVLMPCFGHGR